MTPTTALIGIIVVEALLLLGSFIQYKELQKEASELWEDREDLKERYDLLWNEYNHKEFKDTELTLSQRVSEVGMFQNNDNYRESEQEFVDRRLPGGHQN